MGNDPAVLPEGSNSSRYVPPVSRRLTSLFVRHPATAETTPTKAQKAATHRLRLLAGLVEAVAESGYVNTTLADIVAAARVSRRTFYEHFDNKESCFLAAIAAFNDAMIADIFDAVSDRQEWPERLTAGVDAYVGGIFTDLRVTRVFNVEVFAAGPAAFMGRRSLHYRWATMMRDEILAARDTVPELQGLIRVVTLDQTLAIVGAVADAMQTMVEPQGVPDAAKLRRICLDINVSMTLSAADPYLQLLR